MARKTPGIVIIDTGTRDEYLVYKATSTKNTVVLSPKVFNWVANRFEAVNDASNLKLACTGAVRVKPITAAGPYNALSEFRSLSGSQALLIGIIESKANDVILAGENVVQRLRGPRA